MSGDLNGVRLSKTPGLNAHWQETGPGHDGTHVAFPKSVADALVKVTEAAQSMVEARGDRPSQIKALNNIDSAMARLARESE